ncbi:hypothetical protein DYD21_06845 [Rhodohalobacter sp. SW132]|uniref:hypothetical protein n=1 Tax=Rhodohalobacter sp. SW132 TaxID=2293433 RepID=UPI000E248103|nr:hypothetical protein [Rhodohalobacter sp. SW132]REL38318.1 hypothetical protein DYD21_06845 [Rhodohalobacter sp. SW132]
MKKSLLIILTGAITLFLLFSINERAQAQNLEDSILVTNPGDITFGVGLTQGTSTGFLGNSEFGLTGQIYYTVTEDFRGGVDYTHYLIGERELNASELNFNVHYFVRNRGGLTIYGLGGINVSNTSGSDQRWRVERDLGNPDTRKYGLNIGAGLEIRIGNLVVYGEPKATLLGGSQFVLTGGVRFIL